MVFNLILLLIVSWLVNSIMLFKLFVLAGRKPWEAFIPVYNRFVQTQITDRPWWWIIILYLPIVGPIMHFILHVDFIRCFAKRSWKDTLLVLVTLGLYIGYVAFKKDTKFVGVEKRKETLLSAILYAITFATVVHTFLFQPFVIPTGSMERTLLIGDFLIVNKFAYGTRIPMTPYALPFLQSKTTISMENPQNHSNSYINELRLPYIRIPGYEKVERNKLVVFNFPMDSLHHAIDRKDPYVKRCVAISGDSIKIINGVLYVNGKPSKLPADNEKQASYIVKSSQPLSQEKVENYFGYFIPIQNSATDSLGYINYFSGLTPKDAEKIKHFPGVLDVKQNIEPKKPKEIRYKLYKMYGEYLQSKEMDTLNMGFPFNYDWTHDNFGSLYIPKKGDVITLTKDNIELYHRIIKNYEHNQLEIKGDKYFINGKETHKYTIQQNYYWMMGDNRSSSLDSRFFGFVPEDHIVGKPVFIWLSKQGWFDQGSSKFRWDRMFKVPNNGIPMKDKTSYSWVVILALVLFFGWDFIFKKKKSVKEKNK